MEEDITFTEDESLGSQSDHHNYNKEDNAKKKAKVMDFFSRFKPSKKKEPLSVALTDAILDQVEPLKEKQQQQKKRRTRVTRDKTEDQDHLEDQATEVEEEQHVIPVQKKAKRSYTTRRKAMNKIIAQDSTMEDTTVTKDPTSEEHLTPPPLPQPVSSSAGNTSSQTVEIIDLDDEEEGEGGLMILSEQESVSNPQKPKVNLRDLLNRGKTTQIASPEVVKGNKKSGKDTTKLGKSSTKRTPALAKRRKPTKEIVEILSDDEEDQEKEGGDSGNESLQEALSQISAKEKEDNLKALELKIRQSMQQQQQQNRSKTVTQVDDVNVMSMLNGNKTDSATPLSNNKPTTTNLSSILTSNRIVYKNPIAKLKSIEPPVLSRDLFLVEPKEDLLILRHRTITGLTKRHMKSPEFELNVEHLSLLRSNSNTVSLPHSEITITKCQTMRTSDDILSQLSTTHPDLYSDYRFNHLITSLENPDSAARSNDNNQLLTDWFKPQDINHLLMDQDQVQNIYKWIQHSFQILKKSNFKRQDLKKKSKASSSLQGEFDDFIVYDEEEEVAHCNNDLMESEDEQDSYCPLLIIEGPSGIGKSTIVHTALRQMNGYVHEINTGQSRGRKDILNGLKEICTTQLVHNNTRDKEEDHFQKGVILLEDVDVLFEEDDKAFWSVLTEILQISRRPVILTCEDMDRIPLIFIDCLNEGAKISLKRPTSGDLSGYLYLVGLNYGYDVEDLLIEEIVEDCRCDLRKSLMQLQRLLVKQNVKESVLTVSRGGENLDNSKGSTIAELGEYARLKDIESQANIIQDHSFSQLSTSHDVQEFQIFGHDYQPYEAEIDKSELLPFELDICAELVETFPQEYKSKPPALSPVPLQDLKNSDYFFLISRLQRYKRMTRSIHKNPNLEPTEESQYISFIQKSPPLGYLLDISPYVREFARYEIIVRNYNLRLKQANKWWKKEDLMIGNFNDDPFEYLGQVYSQWK